MVRYFMYETECQRSLSKVLRFILILKGTKYVTCESAEDMGIQVKLLLELVGNKTFKIAKIKIIR